MYRFGIDQSILVMDFARLLNRVINMMLRQLTRRGVNAAVDKATRSSKSSQTDGQKQNKSAKVNSKRLRQSMKAVRRISRF